MLHIRQGWPTYGPPLSYTKIRPRDYLPEPGMNRLKNVVQPLLLPNHDCSFAVRSRCSVTPTVRETCSLFDVLGASARSLDSPAGAASLLRRCLKTRPSGLSRFGITTTLFGRRQERRGVGKPTVTRDW